MSAGSLVLAPTRPRGAWPVAAAAVLGLLGFALLFHAEAAAAVGVWIASTAYNHGFFVLPIAGWLAWDRREAAVGLRPVPTAWPALAVPPLALAWFAADRLGLMEGRQLAALFMLIALLVALLGVRLARVFAAPLAYLVFLVPFGAFLTGPLQSFTARFVDAGLEFLAIPHVVTAFVIEIPEGSFFVAEACAGLRFLIAAVAFGALYALLVYRSPGRRIAFLAASCVVPVIANGLRALGIVVLGHILGSAQAATADHLIYGWGFFSVVILLLIAAGLPFRQDRTARPAPAPTVGASPAPWAGLAAVLLLAATGPAAAAWLDRGRAAPTTTLPGFVATADCIAEDGGFRCAGMRLTAERQALPPGVSPAVLQAALFASTHERGVEEDVTTGRLDVPGVAAPAWRLVEIAAPARAVASVVFIDGAASGTGLRARWRLAQDGVLGGGGPPVLVTVTLTPPMLVRPEQREAAEAVLRGFLAAQGSTLAALAAASAGR